MKAICSSGRQAPLTSLSKSIAKTSMALAIGVSVMATASHAATFTVNGDDFDVTTITGPFDANQGFLESQIWWGDSTLAMAFADVVGLAFGTPNFGVPYGPLFAFDTFDINLTAIDGVDTYAVYVPSTVELFNVGAFANQPLTYAVATPLSAVPLPASGLLLLSGLAGVAALKHRKKRAA